MVNFGNAVVDIIYIGLWNDRNALLSNVLVNFLMMLSKRFIVPTNPMKYNKPDKLTLHLIHAQVHEPSSPSCIESVI